MYYGIRSFLYYRPSFASEAYSFLLLDSRIAPLPLKKESSSPAYLSSCSSAVDWHSAMGIVHNLECSETSCTINFCKCDESEQHFASDDHNHLNALIFTLSSRVFTSIFVFTKILPSFRTHNTTRHPFLNCAKVFTYQRATRSRDHLFPGLHKALLDLTESRFLVSNSAILAF